MKYEKENFNIMTQHNLADAFKNIVEGEGNPFILKVTRGAEDHHDGDFRISTIINGKDTFLGYIRNNYKSRTIAYQPPKTEDNSTIQIRNGGDFIKAVESFVGHYKYRVL